MQSDWINRIEQSENLHAVLLVGPADADLVPLARRAAARYLMHTDDTEKLSGCPFYLEHREQKVEFMRTATESLNRRTFDHGRRCLCIPNLHLQNAQSQNALLKTLEEPPDGALLLLTGQEAGILPTILSRCVILRFPSEPWQAVARTLTEQGCDRGRAELAAKLADGVLARAQVYATDAYQAFRAELFLHCNAILAGMRPYPEASALCTEVTEEVDEQDPEAKPKKKKKVTEQLVSQYFRILLSILGDALRLHVGYTDCANTDCVPLQKKLVSTFTISQIQGMMGVVMEGLRKLSYKATPERVLIWVLASLTEKETHG